MRTDKYSIHILSIRHVLYICLYMLLFVTVSYMSVFYVLQSSMLDVQTN